MSALYGMHRDIIPLPASALIFRQNDAVAVRHQGGAEHTRRGWRKAPERFEFLNGAGQIALRWGGLVVGA